MLVSAYLNQMFDFKPLHCASATNFDLFTDNFISAVRALQNIKLDNITDLMIVHIALKKLDSDTVRAFETEFGSEMPTFDNLVQFIQTRAKVLERIHPSTNSGINKPPRKNNYNRSSINTSSAPPKTYQSYVTTADSAYSCLCKNITHQHLYKCSSFHKMSPQERLKYVKDRNACINCLSIKHRVSSCSSYSNCRVCKLKHHTMLHLKRESSIPAPASHPPPRSTPPLPAPSPPSGGCVRSDIALCTASYTADTDNAFQCNAPANKQCTILLSTAEVVAYNCKGERLIIRALLDSASQSHFITNECCERLGIKPQKTERTIIKGFGGSEKIIDSNSVNIKFYSRLDNNISFNISPLVVDHVTDLLPTAVIDTSVLSHISHLPLADESFGTPNKIDLLIGASLFPHLLLPDVVHASRDSSAPAALRTVLGYVIMGSVPTIPNIHKPPLTCCHVQETAAIDSLVRRFWELEELPTAPPVQHPDDVECEEYYKLTTTRDPVSGRYIVSLPFKDDFYTLGDSFNIARKRFMCLERKLQASPKLRLAYDDVIKDYLTKNYISPAPPYDPRDPTPIYIIPHHAVLREDKSSTKLRMVLDASMPTSGSQRSLNDLLHVGPNLQGNLFTIILGFRLHAIAMTADCRQQFLQIFVREFDRRFQCFLYRFSPQDPLLLYQFNRVCFGIKSSPYHALRTVRQLVEDDGAKYPLASSIASSSLYIDDIAFSIPTECEAVSALQQLIDLFKGAQWDLVKWNSNSKNVLDNLPASHKLLPSAVEFDKTMQHKLLGLHWSSVVDCFYFKITAPADVMCSKRSILSITARLWDMMGFVAPTVVYNIPSDNYYHVSGIEIPADILSRGITPQNLVSHPLWFQGPQWARSDPSDWPLRSLDGLQPLEAFYSQQTYPHRTSKRYRPGICT
ncbi:uncharacterized protein LOC123697073 [Colias croceus]|uniref:uncharacterized protein LOC123697073 n=1 Tax=Colias crocea TaxID=72248 RepID=UPI001E280819|nr:uncharacterized protein LOC123697073 [Colias croceus]